MDDRTKFTWVSFDFILEVIVPFLRVKVIREQPRPEGSVELTHNMLYVYGFLKGCISGMIECINFEF